MSSEAFAARLYAAHLPAAGLPVRAHFAGDRLVVEAPERLQVAAHAIRVTAGGFDRDRLCLGWTERGAPLSLQAEDRAAQAQLVAAAPAVLAPALARWRGGQRRQVLVWRTLAGALAAVLLALALAGSQYDRAADWIAAQVSPETEARLGAATLAQLRASGTLTETGPAAEAVRAIGTRLVAASPQAYRWFVSDDPTINAFALPGAIIVVHRGLIEAAQSADELAGVLAHEVQHVERRHVIKGMVHALGWSAVLGAVFGDTSGLAGALAYEAGQLGYSRELEREADHLGVAALAEGGIDPRGMVAFFRTLAAQAPDTIALLSSHPATRERLAAIEADIAVLPARAYAPLPVDWPAVQAAAARLATRAAEPAAGPPPR